MEDEGRERKGDLEREEADRERFLEEIEEDPEMRQRIAIYRRAPDGSPLL